MAEKSENAKTESYGFTKINNFLRTRNLEYLSNAFICYKIDDVVASQASDCKLMEMGLVYGDVLAFRQIFPNYQDASKSYTERAEELKKKLKRNHVFGKNIKNKDIKVLATYKVTFGLKCFENKSFVSKRNKSFSIDCLRESTYEQLHDIVRNHYKVKSGVATFLAQYNGHKLKSTFSILEVFAISQKSKKKGIFIYLYYPYSYGKLLFKATLNTTSTSQYVKSSDDESVANFEIASGSGINQVISEGIQSCIFHMCGNTTTVTGEECLQCEQDNAYTTNLEADQAGGLQFGMQSCGTCGNTTVSGEKCLQCNKSDAYTTSVEANQAKDLQFMDSTLTQSQLLVQSHPLLSDQPDTSEFHITSLMEFSQETSVDFVKDSIIDNLAESTSFSEHQNNVGNDSLDDHYNLLEKFRLEEREKIQSTLTVKVCRENIYVDMIDLYKKRNMCNNHLNFVFDGENAAGDGVARDAYSTFYSAIYTKMDGYAQRVPRPSMDEEDLIIAGKIITHAFITHGIFPFEFSKASLKHSLFPESLNKTELYESFMQFIMPNEADLFKKLGNGDLLNVQPIIDILTEYSVFDKPTSKNVSNLIDKAGKVALIKNPYFSLQSLVSGMGGFWKKVEPDMFDSLYALTVPTAEKLIESLIMNETSAHDSRITTWLHRYIRNLSDTSVATFTQFVTGSKCLLPDTQIKVEYVNKPPDHLSPTSKTCFKILYLPRQYGSITVMKNNLDMYILNNSNYWGVHDNA